MTSANLETIEDEAEIAARWAVRIAEGADEASDRHELEAWLSADPRNGELLNEIMGSWHAVENYASHDSIMAMREASLAAARREARRRRGRSQVRHLFPFAVSFGAVLLVALVGAFIWLTPHSYSTGIGERRVVALTDGSKLSLDSATRVRVLFSKNARRLWLVNGRARFDVAKDPTRPFTVSAADKDVVATGTAFSVELIQGKVRVVLYEGKVALLERGPSVATRPAPIQIGQVSAGRMLSPGRELILPENSPRDLAPNAAVMLAVDPIRSSSWEEGQLVFEDESLGVVVDRMNRYAEKPLVIGDADAARLRISGVFRAGDTDALVQGLVAAFNVNTQDEPQDIVLKGPQSSVHRS